MRATDVIRDLLDIIDRLEVETTEEPIAVIVSQEESPIKTGVDSNRFKHVFSMLDAERSSPVQYANSPNEVISSLDAVTKDAGGGWNGPKNPADMKSNSMSLYPNHLHSPE